VCSFWAAIQAITTPWAETNIAYSPLLTLNTAGQYSKNLMADLHCIRTYVHIATS
jgi:hypothetical protein